MSRITPFSYKSADEFYYRLSLIFYLLVALPLIPFSMVYLAMQSGEVAPLMGEEMNTPITIALAVLAFANVVLGMQLYRRQMTKLDKTASLRQRFDHFFYASVLQFSCLEAAVVIAVVGLYITRTTFFVLLFLGLVIVFAQVRPELRRMAKELRLNKEEEDLIYQKGKID